MQEPEGYSDESAHETEVDDELNEFSMTAGERIGGNPSASAQTALFDEGDNHSAKRTIGAETLVSRAAALLGSWRKRQSEKITVAVSSPVEEQQDSLVFEDEEEAVIRQDVEDSDAGPSKTRPMDPVLIPLNNWLRLARQSLLRAMRTTRSMGLTRQSVRSRQPTLGSSWTG